MQSQLRETLRRVVPGSVKFQMKRLVRGGGDTKCPLCGSSFRDYVAVGQPLGIVETRGVVGAGLREADACPICNARDRTRLIHLYLTEYVFEPGRRIELLHLAPEYGLYRWLRTVEGLEYTPGDLDPGRYSDIPDVQKADITALPFGDATFDIVLSSHILEHIPDDIAAMRELFRVLKPGGRVLAPVPYATDGQPTDEDLSVTDPGERTRRFGQNDHVRLYALDDYAGRLKSAGFDVELFDPFMARPEEAARRRLNPKEVLPVGLRPADEAGGSADPAGAGSSGG